MEITKKYDKPMGGLNGGIDVYSMDGVASCGCKSKQQNAAGSGELSELTELRNGIIANPGSFTQYVNPANAVNAIDYYLKYANKTPQHKAAAVEVLKQQVDKIFTPTANSLSGLKDVYYVGNINGYDYVADLGALDGRLIRRFRNWTKEKQKDFNKATAKAGEFIKDKAGDVWDGIKKLNPVFIAGRSAYRGLVALNFRGWANRWDRANQADRNRVRKQWEEWGGNYGDLMAAVGAGKRKRALLAGINGGDGELGSVAGVTAALAAAAPIIALANKFLDTVAPQKPEDIANAESTAVFDSSIITPQQAASGNFSFNTQSTKDDGSTKKVLIVGGVVVGLLIVTAAVVTLNKNKSNAGKK